MKILISFILLVHCIYCYSQEKLSGIGFLVQGIERVNQNKFESHTFIYLPANQEEQLIWDSIYDYVLNAHKFRYLIGKAKDSLILNALKQLTKYPFLARHGLNSDCDSLFKSNKIKYDINHCAESRSQRPFSSMISCDSLSEYLFEFQIDKIGYKGNLLHLESINNYLQFMSYRMEDRNNKLLVMNNCMMLADLSKEYQKFKDNFIVFVPEQIRIYDNAYYNKFPDCFFETDK